MRFSGLVLLLSFAATGYALAQAPVSKKTEREVPPAATAAGLYTIFHILDCTKEGYIGPGEAVEHSGILFRHVDKDGSLTISREEFVSYRHEHWAPIRNAMFDKADRNKNGFVSLTEYIKHLESLIVEVDINGDGDTSWEEILTLRGETQEAHASGEGRMNEEKSHKGQGH